MVEPNRGRGRRLPGSPAAARPRLNLNSPGRPMRPRAEDQQPSEASLSNKRPSAPPQIFPLSQVPTGPRQPTNLRDSRDGPAGRASGSAPRGTARGGARARGRKRYTAGGWATPTGPQYAPPAAANGLPPRLGPADAGWTSRERVSTSDKGKAPADGRLPSGPPNRPSSSTFSNGGGGATPIPVPANPRCTLFVGSLPSYITEADLRATFSPFGTVTRVSLRAPKPTHAFAHIAYAAPEEALAALEGLDGRHPTLVSTLPEGIEAEAGPSRGMKVTFAETPAERASRRTSTGGAGDGQLPSFGLFRVPQTPDLTQTGDEVKHELSPSPQKRRNDVGGPAVGSNGSGQRHDFPPRLVPPTLSFENRSIPSIGVGSYLSEDDRTRWPTYAFSYEYTEPLRSVQQERLIEDMEDQLWRDHGRMRVESWSIGPRGDATSIDLRVSVPADMVDSYRQQEAPRIDGVGTAIAGEQETTAAAAPLPTATATSAPPSTSNYFDDAGVAHFRAALPETAIGGTADANRQRKLFLVAQIRRLNDEGNKLVLNSRVEGNEVVIDYMLAEEEEVAADDGDLPASAAVVRSAADPEVAAHPATVVPEAEQMQDVKPFVAAPAASDHRPAAPISTAEPGPTIASDSLRAAMDVDDDEIDQLATPPPGPDAVRFPLQLQPESRADSTETYTAVDAFLKEYFRRFDESRSSLESFYTANALLSVKVDACRPARLLTPQIAFSPQWLAVQNKVATTPVAITNTIRLLPAVSHDVDRLVFTARTIPELHVKSKTRAPILLHIVGQFEEFLEKTVRSFSRTFILVPRPSKTSGAASDGFLVHSDQLAIKHAVPGEPSRLLVHDPPFTPGRGSNPAENRRRAPPAVATADRQANAVNHPLPPHPLLARRQAAFQSAGELAQEPAIPAASRANHAQHDADAPRDGGRTYSPENVSIASPASPPPPSRPAPQRVERPAPLEISSESESSSSRSSHTSVSPEVQRRPLPTSSDLASRSASALGKRPAAIEAPQTQARKKRVGPSAPASGSGSAAGSSAAEAAPARTYTAEELRRLVQQEVAAQLARSAAPGPDHSDAADHEDDAMASLGEARSSSGESRRKEKADADRAAAEQKASAAAAAAAEERKRRAKDQAKAKEKKAKAKAASAQAGPPLGTGLGTSDARILLTGGAQSLLHGFNGSSNKLRHMVDTGSSYLAVSHIGDVVEFSPSPSTLSTTIRKLHSSTSDTYRVDDFAWSDAKDTLVVGFLGIRQGKVLEQPPNQVVLYKRDAGVNGTRLIQDKVDVKPHKSGGVTALTTLPGSGRLRFVTGGEDKQMFIWSRSRSTQEYTTTEVRSNHSSMITSLTYLTERNWLVSSGKDKRLQAYDLEHLNSTWQALLHDPIMTVEPLSSDPFLVLARMSSSRDQFAAYDIRRPPTSSAVLTFGYELAPHRSVRGALASTNMGRYFRGAQCDTIFAFPDYSQGVKLWDLRNVRSAQTHLDLKRQEIPDLGRSKVVQVAFRGRSEMCLMDQSHVTRVTVRG